MGRLKIVMAFLLAAFLRGCVNPATEQKSTELTVAAAANLLGHSKMGK
jgi:ABC-type molybdate transport system substrate-binding protein